MLFHNHTEVLVGAFSLVGKLNHFVVEESNPKTAPDAYCGVTKDCGSDAFPVRLYSGFQNTEVPKICINGKK